MIGVMETISCPSMTVVTLDVSCRLVVTKVRNVMIVEEGKREALYKDKNEITGLTRLQR